MVDTCPVDTYLEDTSKFTQAERLLGEFFSEYDPDLYLVADATSMLERLTKISRLSDAAKARTARRLEKANAHAEQGFKNPET